MATSRINTKRKGTRNEHRSLRVLEAAGYSVFRLSNSLGPWDLVGVSSVDVVFVQVRTRDWPGVLEIGALTEFVTPANVRKLVHRWRDRQIQPDVRTL